MELPGEVAPTRRRTRYRLRPFLLEGSLYAPGRSVLVQLESCVPMIPDAAWLVRLFALSPREAQVPLLLAAGRPNRRVAEELGISAHTVRTHADLRSRKLGPRSRNALGSRLEAAAKAEGVRD